MAALAFGLSGCIGRIIDLFEPDIPVDVTAACYWFDGPRVRPGISLVVSVGSAGAAPQTMHVLVDQNGDITLPHLLQEPVACNGLTLEALKKKLVKAYGVYYKQPQVTVTFAQYDGNGVSPWGTVTVLGEVGSPGPVNMPSTMDLTVTKVLKAAGGCRGYADRNRIRVTRCDKDGKLTQTTVSLSKIGEEGRADLDMSLRAGDVVWVPASMW